MLLTDFWEIGFGNTPIFLKLSRKCRARVIDKSRQFIGISPSGYAALFFGIFRKFYGLVYRQIYRQSPRKLLDTVTGILSINRKCSVAHGRIADFIVVFSITFLMAGR
jgi:hypothetical protein